MNNMKNNMKSLIVLILMAALLPHAAIAQTGLHSDAVFKGQVVPQNAMVEVKVRGRTLSRYRLTFYHSVRFNATAQQKASINNLVERDAKQAVSGDKETRRTALPHPQSASQRTDAPLSLLYLRRTRKQECHHPRLYGRESGKHR